MRKASIVVGALALATGSGMAAADPLLPNRLEVRIYRGKPTPDQVRSIGSDPQLELVEQIALNPDKPATSSEIACSGPPCHERGIVDTLEIVGPVWHQKIQWIRRHGDHRVVTETPVEYRDGHYASRTLLFEGVAVTMTGSPITYLPAPLCPAFGPPPPQPIDHALPPRSSIP